MARATLAGARGGRDDDIPIAVHRTPRSRLALATAERSIAV
jgi:hypothetical protein